MNTEEHAQHQSICIKGQTKSDEDLKKTQTTVGDMVGIVRFDVVEKHLLRHALFQIFALRDLAERTIGGFFVHAEELTGFHPFIARDMPIMIEIEHVKGGVDSLGQLGYQLGIRAWLTQLLGEPSMKVKPLFYADTTTMIIGCTSIRRT